jgi:hypothetical protein
VETFSEDELVDWYEYYKAAGFGEYSSVGGLTLSFLSEYGSDELRKKLWAADAFDKPPIERQIKQLLEEIRKKKFFITPRMGSCKVDNVGGTHSSCHADYYVGFLPFSIRFDDMVMVEPANMAGPAVYLLKEENVDGMTYSYRSGKFLTISISGPTEKIKDLVRSEKEFACRIVVTNYGGEGGAKFLDIRRVDIPNPKDEPKSQEQVNDPKPSKPVASAPGPIPPINGGNNNNGVAAGRPVALNRGQRAKLDAIMKIVDDFLGMNPGDDVKLVLDFFRNGGKLPNGIMQEGTIEQIREHYRAGKDDGGKIPVRPFGCNFTEDFDVDDFLKEKKSVQFRKICFAACGESNVTNPQNQQTKTIALALKSFGEKVKKEEERKKTDDK